jgi:hypothetical protein
MKSNQGCEPSMRFMIIYFSAKRKMLVCHFNLAIFSTPTVFSPSYLFFDSHLSSLTKHNFKINGCDEWSTTNSLGLQCKYHI